MPWRFSCVAANQEELLEALDKGSKKTDAITRISPDVKISFGFTGQGAQWAGTGRELLSNPTFNDSIHQSKKILHDLGSSWDLVEELLWEKEESRLKDVTIGAVAYTSLLPPTPTLYCLRYLFTACLQPAWHLSAWSLIYVDHDFTPVHLVTKEAELAQPATTAIQIALVDLVRRWGSFLIRSSATPVARLELRFSAAISKEKGLRKGGMLAVGVGEHDVAQYLKMLKQGVAVVACQNSPSSTTISGDDAAISELWETLTQEAIFNRKLNVDTAYHSRHMQAAAGEYKAGLSYIVEDSSPKTTVKMFSSVTGSLKSSGFGGDYWTSNLVSKVRFCDALQALYNPTSTYASASASTSASTSAPRRVKLIYLRR
ncbi:FabD/lysophospholipase-like protein [Zopfia rhizophila CBS 207.26]|uniref:FabD/lysophospholipase-like protein n=1 Tax=Zopfia rhizophila CBS 207.26 TaxID=1314779 RepID=A0A6A6DV48_9PEZI|nr:FabD/lysophospholipase-like protein [Zopfia rhizophila CBS 207.26]